MDSEDETEAEPVQGSAKTAPGPRSESRDASQSEPGRESEDVSQTVSQTVSAGSDTPPVQGFEYSGDPDVSDRPRLALVPELPPELNGVTLTEALRDGLVSGTIDAIRKASTREGFPEPVGRRGNGNTYDPTELMMWAKWRGKNVG